MKDTDRLYDTKIDLLNKRVTVLLKEIASLSRNSKRVGGNLSKDSGGSGTDSPSTN